MEKFFKDHICPIIGFSILTGVYYLSLVFFLGLIYGNFYVRASFLLIYLYQCTLCKRSQTFSRIMTYLKPYNYFPTNGTIFEEETPFSDKKNMVAFHPHGIMATLFPLNYYRTEQFKNFHFLATGILSFIPFGGLISIWVGIEPVNPNHFEFLMKREENIVLLPGGFEEATITNHNQDQVWIKNRKGFIKYGLKYGYNLYPCYSFNENRIFSCFTQFESLRLFFNRWKAPGVFFWGKYGLLPRRDLKTFTVVGRRITLPKLEIITKEDIDKYHQLYIEKLEELYNKYREKFDSSEKLIIK